MPAIKNSLRLALLILIGIPFILSEVAFGQCGTPPPAQPDTSGTRGGTRIPTWNPINPTDTITVNCVVILVDFPDDNTDSDNPVWPATFDPTKHPWQASIGWSATNRPPHPDMMADLIDLSIVSPGPTGKKWNITTYFRDMSYGKFNLIGHVVYQQARHPFYSTTNPSDTTYVDNPTWNGSRSVVIRHVIEDLQERIDSGQVPNVFEGTDNWNHLGSRNFLPGEDNVVDLVIVGFRNDRLNHPNWSSWRGIVGLNGLTMPIDDGTTDSSTVVSSFGTTVQNMKDYPNRESIDVIWHEVGHLIGLGHQYWDGMWSVMTHGSEGFFMMNAWERWQVGWLEFFDYDPATSMQGNGDTLTICDVAVHPQAIRIRLPDTSEGSQYFYVEHHEQASSGFISNLPPDSLPWYDSKDVMTYDIIDDSVICPGLYITHNDGRTFTSPPDGSGDSDQGEFRVIAADGRWHWVADGWATAPWSTTQQLRLYRRGKAARSPSGPEQDTNVYETWNTYKTDRQKLDMATGNSPRSYDYIWSWKENAGSGEGVTDLDTVNTGRVRRKGDGGDAWSPLWNNVFSPWSNPNTNAYGGGATGIAVQLLSQNDTSTTVKVWLSGSLNAPPSKPQHLVVYTDNLMQSVLTWETNPESDVDSAGGYIIQRCDAMCDQDSNWYAQDTVDGDVSLWTDTLTVDLLSYSHRYRIKAYDTQDLESVWSEWFHLYGGGDAEEDPPLPSSKTVAGSLIAAAIEAKLSVGSNPAESRLLIEWRNSEDGAVSIRIFDLKGRQVAWPVNTFSLAGTYNEAVDVSDLPTGTYICVLMYNGHIWSAPVTVK